jgi:hypothetical protein
MSAIWSFGRIAIVYDKLNARQITALTVYDSLLQSLYAAMSASKRGDKTKDTQERIRALSHSLRISKLSCKSKGVNPDNKDLMRIVRNPHLLAEHAES